MRISAFLVILMTFLMCSCESNDDGRQSTNESLDICTESNRYTEQDMFSESEIISVTNITYGNAIDWLGNNQDLVMDVYYPDLTEDEIAQRPAILLIHGGGFIGGNKSTWADECLSFAKKGYVAFSLGYRLGWDINDPTDQVLAVYRAHQDASAAMRYIVANAATYGIDTNWLFIGGSSAGAVTALNDIYVTQDEWNAFFPGIEASLGGLNTSGNTLSNTYQLKGVFNNWGATILDYIDTSEMVPMVAFHGDQDSTVPIDIGEMGFSGSRVISNLLDFNNVCFDLTVEPGGGHGIYTNASGTEFRVGRASCFFKSIMCDNCTDFNATTRIDANCSI